MANCPNCGASYVSGSPFCDDCGFDLLSSAPASAASVQAQPPSPAAAPAESPPPPKLEGMVAADTRSCPKCSRSVPIAANFCDNCGYDLRVVGEKPVGARLVLSTGEIVVPDKQEVIIGRSDPQSGWFPDIDLISHGGYEKGVSRDHARLIKNANGGWSIIHKSQTNRTLVNQQAVQEQAPSVLNDGDEIFFGSLKATFRQH